ncbi:outer dense fiber protein 3 isoform X1 [Nilaparvata lugens]|uniref:outer dense fiber protein 3 isoform X1 n=1 Tax=Nilaparvata lugens TaxID=108931 RepID=UPI00193E2192|nr:outer dense fiber protein 3 isoform X1 [Nilaparvata lugens]XP_039295019.1 outer dense fiber protein 3 isoform X1 [Nilaparvata lugens]
MGGFQQRPWTPTKRRGPIAAEYSSPGPACVTLPTLVGTISTDSKRGRAPAFSFGSRHGGKLDTAGPGPGQYNVTGLSAKGKDTPPAATLHSRPKESKSETTPAPGDYNPEKSEKIVHDNSPKYTFGLKTTVEKTSSTPAPNVYNIPAALGNTKEGNKRAAPAFSISGRQKEFIDDRVNTPGPGAYNSISADSIKAKSPAYSVSSRYTVPSDHSTKPGPGAYSPEKVQIDIPQAHTFGIRHSDFRANMSRYVY